MSQALCSSHHTCLQCDPQSYIRMVQHLIERCLLLRMNQDDCIEALARHASIHPRVTLTVWKVLMKENKDFFRTYFHAPSPRTLISSIRAQRMRRNKSMNVRNDDPNIMTNRRIYY